MLCLFWELNTICTYCTFIVIFQDRKTKKEDMFDDKVLEEKCKQAFAMGPSLYVLLVVFLDDLCFPL